MDQNYNEYMRCIDETTHLYNLVYRMYETETIGDLDAQLRTASRMLDIIYKGNCQRIYDTHKIRTFFGKTTDRILDLVERHNMC